MPRPPISPAIRRGLDKGAHLGSRLGYKVLPSAFSHWRSVTRTANVPYRDTGSRAHVLDIYRPREARRALPTVFYVHGGAFSMCSKDTHQIMGYQLAARGYQVFMINYRIGPGRTYPGPLEDASAALLWVLEHGAEYGADTSRLAIMGESAGANLATALVYCATHRRPERFARRLFDRAPNISAALPLYGALDLVDMERLWATERKSTRMAGWIKREIEWTSRSYVGHPRRERAIECALASPLRLLEEGPTPGSRPLPPFFSVVGTADPLIGDTVRLRDAVRARGATCEMKVYRGELHAFNAMLWRPAARDSWKQTYAFLDKHIAAAVMCTAAAGASTGGPRPRTVPPARLRA